MLISLMALKSLVVNTVAAKEYIAREVITVQISSVVCTQLAEYRKTASFVSTSKTIDASCWHRNL